MKSSYHGNELLCFAAWSLNDVIETKKKLEPYLKLMGQGINPIKKAGVIWH